LLRDKPPSLRPYSMRQNRWGSHSPRPLCIRHDMRVDGSRIAHVIYPSPEESFYWCSEVKGHHSCCYGSHTSGLHTRRWGLVGCLRGFGGGGVIGGIALERDSSARTGAGRHRISWVGSEVCGRMGGVRFMRSRRCAAWDGHKMGNDFGVTLE
jgi:hypothetical protein